MEGTTQQSLNLQELFRVVWSEYILISCYDKYYPSVMLGMTAQCYLKLSLSDVKRQKKDKIGRNWIATEDEARDL